MHDRRLIWSSSLPARCRWHEQSTADSDIDLLRAEHRGVALTARRSHGGCRSAPPVNPPLQELHGHRPVHARTLGAGLSALSKKVNEKVLDFVLGGRPKGTVLRTFVWEVAL